MHPSVLLGSSIPAGIDHIRLHKQLKQGDIVLTLIPQDKQEALSVARYCKENRIYLCFSELLYRGSTDLCFAYRKRIAREQFHSKSDIDEIIDAAGEYYFGRICIGEYGGTLYWPKKYTIDRKAVCWENLPKFETADKAKEAYVAGARKYLEYEKSYIGKGPLLNCDASMTFKYLSESGVDKLCLEALPGDPHLMYASIRGAARAADKLWGAHIAMLWYGGVSVDELFQKRWRTSVFFSYIAGADFIYPESGHYTYDAFGKDYGFDSAEMKRIRLTMREAWQFGKIHNRPAGGPRTALGVVYGNLDGSPGLWNRYVWGQYYDEKWLESPAERGWRFVDKFHRRQEWSNKSVQGKQDFSGNPPYGQYDVVPIESKIENLQKYKCLFFLSWNTMTPEIYGKLKQYVSSGGHLVMYLPHLSMHVDREKDIELFKNGDFSDLFGVKIKGKLDKDVRGFKCVAQSSLESYRFPYWRTESDPRFCGNMTPSDVEIGTAKIVSVWSDYYDYGTSVENFGELSRQPILTENSLGKGKAFLVTAWEYPADEGLAEFTEDILDVVLAGEQGDIRLMGSDRVRYSVYDGQLPGQDEEKYSVIYLLNTDPDCAALCKVWLNGHTTEEIKVGAGELCLIYKFGDILMVCQDKCVGLTTWKSSGNCYHVEVFNVRDQEIEIHNLGIKETLFSLNGEQCVCKSDGKRKILLKKCVNPEISQFFAEDFLEEPKVEYIPGELPY